MRRTNAKRASPEARKELGWLPQTMFEEGIVKTVRWYLEHRDWWEKIVSGEYRDYYERMYAGR